MGFDIGNVACEHGAIKATWANQRQVMSIIWRLAKTRPDYAGRPKRNDGYSHHFVAAPWGEAKLPESGRRRAGVDAPVGAMTRRAAVGALRVRLRVTVKHSSTNPV
jgi:hypothetical protein